VTDGSKSFQFCRKKKRLRVDSSSRLVLGSALLAQHDWSVTVSAKDNNFLKKDSDVFR
jgi:hypothetical protein